MTRLSQTLAGARIQRELLARGLGRQPVCPDCKQDVDPSGWALHRQQLCTGRPPAERELDKGPGNQPPEAASQH